MTFPYKESLIYFERLAECQKSMYTDAADQGILMDEKGLNDAREHLRTLKKFYGGKNWTLKTSIEQAAVNNIVIPIEQVGRDTYNCIVLSVNCITKKKGRWLSINIDSRLEVEQNIAVFREL